jgi:hypothetical protein
MGDFSDLLKMNVNGVIEMRRERMKRIIDEENKIAVEQLKERLNNLANNKPKFDDYKQEIFRMVQRFVPGWDKMCDNYQFEKEIRNVPGFEKLQPSNPPHLIADLACSKNKHEIEGQAIAGSLNRS